MDGMVGPFYSCIRESQHLMYLYASTDLACKGMHHLVCSVNVRSGIKEERMLMTGLHSVADIFCVGCGSRLGWKYLEAFEKR